MKVKTSPRMHVSRKPEYLCETCLKTFRDKSDFGRHINRKNPCSAPEKPDEEPKLVESNAESHDNVFVEHHSGDEPNEHMQEQGCRAQSQAIPSDRDNADGNDSMPEVLSKITHLFELSESGNEVTELVTPQFSGDEVETCCAPTAEAIPEVSTMDTPEQSIQESTRRKPRAPRKKGVSKPDDGVAVLPLGSENLDHLTSMKYPRLKKLIECKPEPSTVIRMVQAVHLDKKVLQNFNVRIDNTSATVFQRSPATRKCEWVQMSKDAAVEKLVTNGIIHFYNIAHVLEENMKKTNYDELMDYLDKIDTAQNDKEADEDINLDVEAIADGVGAALANRCN